MKLDKKIPNDWMESHNEKLKDWLDDFEVPMPTESEIDATISKLTAYMPSAEQHASITNQSKLERLVQLAALQIPIFSKTYWVSCLLILSIGILSLNSGAGEVSLVPLVLVPLPFLFGLFELFRNRDEGMLELEMTCMISAPQLMISRLLWIVVNSILLNCFIFIALWSVQDALSSNILWLWLLPLSVISSLSLWVSMRYKGRVPLVSLFIGWIVISYVVATNTKWLHMFLALPKYITLAISVVGMLFFLLQVWKLVTKYKFTMERFLDYEADL